MRHKCLFPGLWLALGIIALALGEALGVTSGSADPLPIKIAVFDFELDDSSAGAEIAGDRTKDAAQLNQATEQARLLMAQSGRYSLVISATDMGADYSWDRGTASLIRSGLLHQ